MAVVAGSSRRRAFHNPRGRLRPRRGTRAGQVPPGAVVTVAGECGARAASTEGELNIMEKGGGMGACGVGMMQVDYIFRGENLKYIRVLLAHHSERYPRKAG